MDFHKSTKSNHQRISKSDRKGPARIRMYRKKKRFVISLFLTFLEVCITMFSLFSAQQFFVHQFPIRKKFNEAITNAL